MHYTICQFNHPNKYCEMNLNIYSLLPPIIMPIYMQTGNEPENGKSVTKISIIIISMVIY